MFSICYFKFIVCGSFTISFQLLCDSLVEQTTQGTFNPYGREDILNVSI